MGRSHDQEFSKFAVEHRDALLRTAFLLTGDRGLAEDLVQTALVKAYLAWGRIRSRDAAGAYTRRIMVTTAISWRRRRWWRAERPSAVGSVETQGIDPQDGAALGDLVTDRAWVWDAVQSLPPRQRAVVVLRFYTDLTEQQTAEAMECSVGTVKSQTHDALATLRRRLGSRLGDLVGTSDVVEIDLSGGQQP